ncbi:MAG TPA: hypothetical protein VLN49_17500, partial [Gemmatimonadaceae bacterium]|nr:hypothetical protein [Gemmatimonadaceae bacterium]
VLEAFTYGSDEWPDGDDRFDVGYLKRGRPLAADGYQLENADRRDDAWLRDGYADAEHRDPAG